MAAELPTLPEQETIAPNVDDTDKPDVQDFIPYEQGSLRIDFIDIGQGDSMLIIFPDGKNMIIDGGSTLFANSSAITSCLDFYDITQIDYLMLTHPHSDHCNSLTAVLKRYSVKEFFLPPLLPSYGKENAKTLKGHFDTKTYYKFYQEVEKQETKGAVINYNIDVFSIIGADYSFDFYCYGAEAYQDISGKSSNDTVNALSPIGFLYYNEVRYCFTGDSNAENESYFLANYAEQGIQSESFLLKVPHHGSKTSSTQEFLSAISPEVAVICVGSNIYGHPNKNVLQRLYGVGATVYNTRDNGRITVSQKGEEVKIEPVVGKVYYYISASSTDDTISVQVLFYIIPASTRIEQYYTLNKAAIK